MQQSRKSKLMSLSWQIQNRHGALLERKCVREGSHRSIRSLALERAWTIMQTEELTIHHLVKRYSHDHNPNRVNPNSLTLFSHA